MCPSPFSSGCDSSFLVLLPPFCDFGRKGVVGVGGAEEGLDREEDSTDLESWGPVTYRVMLIEFLKYSARDKEENEATYSSGHLSRCDRACRCLGGRS